MNQAKLEHDIIKAIENNKFGSLGTAQGSEPMG